MTFVLKELSELKAHFKVTTDLLLQHNKKTSIEELHEPRREEMILMKKTLDKIEELITLIQKNSSKEENDVVTQKVNQLIYVFYGASLLAKQDALKLRGQPGKLSNRVDELTDIANKDETKRPDIYLQAKFQIAINEFLHNELFYDGNSRMGFKHSHPLTMIKNDVLKRILATSFELEQTAQKKVIKSLAANDGAAADIKNYTVNVATPELAIKPFILPLWQKDVANAGAWEHLKTQLQAAITQEYSAKNKATIDELGEPRAPQLHLVNTVRQLLDQAPHIENQEKIAILAGTMHLIRQDIREEYKKAYLFSKIVTDPSKSIIQSEFSKILDVTSDYDVDTKKIQDVEALIHAANNFIRYLSIVSIPTEEQKEGITKAISKNNPFAKIENLDLPAKLNLFQDMICTYRTAAVSEIILQEQNEKLEKVSKASAKGYSIPSISSVTGAVTGGMAQALTAFSGVFTTKKAEEEEDDLTITPSSTNGY